MWEILVIVIIWFGLFIYSMVELAAYESEMEGQLLNYTAAAAVLFSMALFIMLTAAFSLGARVTLDNIYTYKSQYKKTAVDTLGIGLYVKVKTKIKTKPSNMAKVEAGQGIRDAETMCSDTLLLQ